MTEQIEKHKETLRRAQIARRLVAEGMNADESIHVETSNKGRVSMPNPDAEEDEEQDERTLAEKLNDIETDTINGNRVRASITKVKEITDGEGIQVHAELPSGRVVTKRFEMPDSNAKNYKLVRFMGAYGYTIGELDEFEDGTKVDVEIDGNGPTFIIPEEPVREGREEMGAREWISDALRGSKSVLKYSPATLSSLFIATITGGVLRYLSENPELLTGLMLTPFGRTGEALPFSFVLLSHMFQFGIVIFLVLTCLSSLLSVFASEVTKKR